MGKFHWVLQLINNQKEKLFYSLRKKLPDEQNSSNQPDQSQSQTHDRSGHINTTFLYKMTLKYIMRSRCSTLTIKHFVKESRKTWTSKFQDYQNSILKHAQSASVRELIQKIENHPNRHALQQDPRQNPFSPETKQMIHEVGNIELCELLDTDTKTQCKVCLSYWDIGIVYCRCGHFLRKGTEENKKFVQYTVDLLSIPDYYIKKGDLTGTVTGKSKETGNTTSPIS